MTRLLISFLSFILRNATPWYRASAALPGDSTLASYLVSGGFGVRFSLLICSMALLQEFQRIMSRCLDILYSGTTTPSGLQTEVDYLLIIKSFESQMEAWRNDWVAWRNAWGGSQSRLPCYSLNILILFRRGGGERGRVQEADRSILLQLRDAPAQFVRAAQRDGAVFCGHFSFLRAVSSLCNGVCDDRS